MEPGPLHHYPRLPDWLIYVAIVMALLIAAVGRRENADAPPAPPPVEGEEALPLSPTSPFAADELVSARRHTEAGSAFSVGETGVWVTARHVVRYCHRVALMVAEGRGVIAKVRLDPKADMALLITEGGAPALPMMTKKALLSGERGFHPGYPQGGAGEATSRFLGRDTLPARRRGEARQKVLAWAESGRTDQLTGSLAGLSGAPVLDAGGEVVGVTLAEQPRRGRIYTSAPEPLIKLIAQAKVRTPAAPLGEPITVENYGRVADSLRRDLRVAQVICLTK
ncbi:serine protease [soil metagenome]